MGNRLEGKVALITGGGSGIGAAIAKRFASEGAKIVVAGRRKEKLEETAAALQPGTYKTVTGDVSKPAEAEAMVAATVEFGGKIDILVNCAAAESAGTITEVPLEVWSQVLDTNLSGTFHTMRFAIPHMLEAKAGSIVNISSLAALRCIPNMAPYIASKSAVIGLSKSCALDYSPRGVRCNVICPGPVNTNMLAHGMEPLAKALDADIAAAMSTLTRLNPIPRVAVPDEIAGAAVYLASDESSFVTGSVLTVDGGACVVDPNGAAVASSGANWG